MSGYGFDVSSWHGECSGVDLFNSPLGLILWCPVCRVYTNAEAVANKVPYSETHKVGKTPRKVFSKQNPNFNTFS